VQHRRADRLHSTPTRRIVETIGQQPGISQTVGGNHDDQCYLSMGFVEGQSLSHRQAEGPFPPREAAELMVAEAIE
jgi:hypothetical protein